MRGDVPFEGNAPAGGSPSAAVTREEFAACLRALRVQAGAPSFRNLAKITHYSSSTLADATAGRRLPTEPVLTAFVTACGADPEPWLAGLRRIAAAELAGTPPEEAGPASETGMRARGAWRRWSALGAGMLALGAGFTAGRMTMPATRLADVSKTRAGLVLAGVPPFSGTPAPAPTGRVSDGTDPYAGHCTPDAYLVDKAPLIQAGAQIGALELWYSPSCGAGWARVYLYPGQPTMMGEVTVRSGDDRFTTIANPLVKQVPDYTDVIVPGRGGCLGAGSAVYESGRPIVTAALPCEAPAPPQPGARQRPATRYP